MGNFVLAFFRSFIKDVGTDGTFYIFLGGVFVIFSVCFFISLLSRRIRGKSIKRAYLILSISLLLLETGIIFLSHVDAGGIIFHILFNTAIILLFYLFLSMLPENFARVRKGEKTLIKDIDRHISAPEVINEQRLREKPPIQFSREKKVESIKTVSEPFCEIDEPPIKDSDGIDFTHVKNILSRLEYYNLSPTDQKQVGELKASVYRAENFGVDKETKSKISDGLGALLKIMSKYGV